MVDSERVVLAKQGDSAAAAEIISAHLPYWMGAARQIIAADGRSLSAGGPREEPAELVQEATLKLLEQWRQGQGPASNPRSYVTAIMRNNYANKFRSPRARERPLDALALEQDLTVTSNMRHAELSLEMEMLRRALDGLIPDQRAVLVAVTVEGKKPGELTEELGRPAPAISNLLSRAKHALFRQLLVEHLSSGEAECRENAERLPARVHEDPEYHPGTDPGMRHVRECEHCQRNWRRFAAILSAFGLLPLVLVTQLTDSSAPAAASDGDPSSREHAEDPPREAASSSDSGPGTASPGLSEAGAHAAPTVTTANGASVGEASGVGRVASVLSSKAVIWLGAACFAAAAAALALAGHAAFSTGQGEEITYTGELAEQNPYGADLTVTLDTDEEGALRAIRADFEIAQAAGWAIRQVTLTLSPGTELRSTPYGLGCETAGEVTSCAPVSGIDFWGTIVFEVENPDPGGTFSLRIDVEADGDAGTGSATGRW